MLIFSCTNNNYLLYGKQLPIIVSETEYPPMTTTHLARFQFSLLELFCPQLRNGFMRTILATAILMVARVAFAGDYSIDAFTTASGPTGGGMFAAPVPANVVRAGWGGPTVPFRVHLVRVTGNQQNQFAVAQSFTPTAASQSVAFVAVAPGEYIVAVATAPNVWIAASWAVTVK